MPVVRTRHDLATVSAWDLAFAPKTFPKCKSLYDAADFMGIKPLKDLVGAVMVTMVDCEEMCQIMGISVPTVAD